MNPDDLPEVRRVPPPEPDPREVRFVPRLDAAPLALSKPEPPTVVDQRRAKAEHFCLWLGCSRALCRRARHCLGTGATCVFEQDDVKAPLL